MASPEVRAPKANPSLQALPGQGLVVRNSPIRTPGADEALIHVKATGVCGSDIHLWKHGHLGPVVLQDNHILGHESSGIVLEVGSHVSHIQPGDRVAVEPLLPCGDCSACHAGHKNLCDLSTLRGVYGPPATADGSCQRYFVHPARLLHPMPEDMTFQQAALLEPLSVSLQASRNADIRLGAPALVCGAGPIGLLTLSCLRAAGAWPIVITDVEPKRLQFAKDFMPDIETYLVDLEKKPESAAQELRKIFVRATQRKGNSAHNEEGENDAPMTVLECTGFSSSIITGCYAVRKAGTVMVIGAGSPLLDGLPASLLMSKEIVLKYSRTYQDTWPACFNLIAGGLVKLDKLVTHTFPLEKADEALKIAADPSRGSIKVQIIDEIDITD